MNLHRRASFSDYGCRPEPFWGDPDPGLPHDTPVIDAAFVDDECIMLTATSSTLLGKAIGMLLEKVALIFARLALDLNWKRGKSECLVKFRGHGATATYQSHRVDGCIVFEVPEVPSLSLALVLHAVDRYTYLGCVTTSSGNLTPYARLALPSYT